MLFFVEMYGYACVYGCACLRRQLMEELVEYIESTPHVSVAKKWKQYIGSDIRRSVAYS